MDKIQRALDGRDSSNKTFRLLVFISKSSTYLS